VERKESGRLGANPEAPLVASRRSTQEKAPWRDVPDIEQTVEREFLHPVLLGESILPYRLFRTFEGVVPVTPAGRVLDAPSADEAGFERLGAWMRRAEALWDRHGRGKRRFVEQLDYIRQLSSQFPIAPVRVVYAASGSLPAATVLRDRESVVEHKLYWAAASSELEAAYLAAILNSETARSLAERYQSRGQFGARDFDKVMFNLPIPVFDERHALHRNLAEAGRAAERAAGLVELVEGEQFQRARRRVRSALAHDGVGGEIELLVGKLLAAALNA